jgi:hypothetical protein
MRPRAIPFTLGFLALACLATASESPPDLDRDIPFHGGTTVRFATAEEAAKVLGARDDYVRAMSPLDRMFRLKSEAPVDEDRYLKHAASQAMDWGKEEIASLTAHVESASRKLDAVGLHLPLPETILLVRTSAGLSFGLPHTRQNAIILPETYLQIPAAYLEQLLLHETFHVMTRHRPEIRDALFAVLGFEVCGEVALPEPLAARLLANPDAYHTRHCIVVEAGGESVPVVPVAIAKVDRFTGGNPIEAVDFKLMAIEKTNGEYRPRLDSGEPILHGRLDVEGYFEKIGRNTMYTIHPEEIAADNFALMVRQADDVSNPEILEAFRKILSQE